MTKQMFDINLTYTFDAGRSGAKYTLDGVHYMNSGEFAEVVTKSVLGFEAHKDANTSYDKGSDIEELNASVKSSKASLTSMVLADTFEESMNVYFENTHSSLFIYTVVMDETATLYMMNASEFRAFMTIWAKLNERGVIRFKATSGKMVAWLEERC